MVCQASTLRGKRQGCGAATRSFGFMTWPNGWNAALSIQFSVGQTLEYEIIIYYYYHPNKNCAIIKIIISIIVKCAKRRAHCKDKDDGIVLQPDVPVLYLSKIP